MLINLFLFTASVFCIYSFGSLVNKFFFLSIYKEKFDEEFFSNLFFGIFFIGLISLILNFFINLDNIFYKFFIFF